MLLKRLLAERHRGGGGVAIDALDAVADRVQDARGAQHCPQSVRSGIVRSGGGVIRRPEARQADYVVEDADGLRVRGGALRIHLAA